MGVALRQQTTDYTSHTRIAYEKLFTDNCQFKTSPYATLVRQRTLFDVCKEHLLSSCAFPFEVSNGGGDSSGEIASREQWGDWILVFNRPHIHFSVETILEVDAMGSHPPTYSPCLGDKYPKELHPSVSP